MEEVTDRFYTTASASKVACAIRSAIPIPFLRFPPIIRPGKLCSTSFIASNRNSLSDSYGGIAQVCRMILNRSGVNLFNSIRLQISFLMISMTSGSPSSQTSGYLTPPIKIENNAPSFGALSSKSEDINNAPRISLFPLKGINPPKASSFLPSHSEQRS
jgi:hypothetical protein